MSRTRLSHALTLGGIAVTMLACSRDDAVTSPAAPPAPSIAPAGPAADPQRLLGSVVGGVVGTTTGLLNAVVGLVTCEPIPTAVATRTIGPAGGEVRVGPHRLFVPAGALAADVQITGTTLSGSYRGVDFQPHGLRFLKPVRLTLDYDRCAVPSGEGAVQVVYTDADNQIVSWQPSVDNWWERKVVGLTDHFSGYVVAFGVE